MLVVHHLNNSRSHRILWLLEELAVPYELRRYQRDPETMLAPRELRAIHPLGKSPVVTDGEDVVAESGAIIEYILDRHDRGHLRPEPGTPEHLQYRYWLHYAEGSAMSPLLLKLVFMRLEQGVGPLFLRPVIRQIARQVQAQYVDKEFTEHMRYWEAHLARHEWFAGEAFCAADVQMSFPLEAAESRADLGACPHINRFLTAIRQRPAYQRAVEAGGPFDLNSAFA